MPTVWLRFKGLVAKGVVSNWPQLRILIKSHGFPVGRFISPHVRAWSEAEVDSWLESRPLADSRALPLRGAAKAAAATRAAKKAAKLVAAEERVR